jgi:ABC-2 type transport system permease protein
MRSAEYGLGASFFAVARLSAREFVAYPADVISEFFTYPIVFLCYYFFLQALSRFNTGHLDVSIEQLTLYYSLGWLLRMVFHQRTDTTVSEMVAHGDIVNQLLRPMEFKTWLLAQASGYAAARIVLYAAPGFVLLIAFLDSFRNLLPANPLFFLCSALCGFLILFELQVLIGGIAFFTTMNFQISWTLDMISRLISGLVVPLSLLPLPVQRILDFLPFPHIYAYPIQAWISPGTLYDWLPVIVRAFFWLAFLHWVNHKFYQQALKRLVIYGG